MPTASHNSPNNLTPPQELWPLSQAATGSPQQILRDREVFLKGIVHSPNPGEVLQSFREDGLIARLLPEMIPMWGPLGLQNPITHPEGCTFEHTKMVLDLLPPDPLLRLAGAFHDVAKPLTQDVCPYSGRISNHGHEVAGANLFQHQIGPRLLEDLELISSISTIIRYHTIMHVVREVNRVPPAMLNFLLGHPLIESMIQFEYADIMGTTAPREEKLKHTTQEYMLAKLADFNRLRAI